MKKTKLLATILLTGCVFAGMVACGPSDPDDPGIITPSKAEFEFKGTVELKGTSHEVTLKGYKDNKFEVSIKDVTYEGKGTYQFIDKVGYKFTFANGTEVSTTFDNTNKDHILSFEVKAGDAGSGTCTLKLHDEDFVLDVTASGKAAFIEKANFTGTASVPGDTPQTGKSYPATLKLESDGTLSLKYEKNEVLNKTGTYTFNNNTFTLTIDGKEYTSSYDLGTGGYLIAYKQSIDGAERSFNLTWNTTVSTIGGRLEDRGGMNCDLYIYGNHTALFDITVDSAPAPIFQTMLDKPATWTRDNKGFTFTMGDGTTTYTVTKDATTNEYSFDYPITGPDGTYTFEMTGGEQEIVALQDNIEFMGSVNILLAYKDGGIVTRDVTGAGPASTLFDTDGTYTFENNVIKTTIGDQTVNSTWDEATGTYTVDGLIIKGTETNLEPNCTLSLWGE